MSKTQMEGYGFTLLGGVRVEGNDFVIAIADANLAGQTMCLYAVLIGDDIVRIGSSKAPLSSRMRSWQRDVSGALAGRKTSTPASEAAGCRKLLADRDGAIFARKGTLVATQIGTFNAYLAEESYLIGLHRPKQNRSMHR
jgi:hypothetical protein